MSKVKFLTISTVVLLLINLGLVGFLLFGPHRHHHREPKIYIVQKLGLDAEQIVHYEEIIKTHQAAIRTNEAQIVQLKEDLYKGLIDNYQTINKDSIINVLGRTQQAIEEAHVAHFLELKAICKKEQLPQFEALAQELGKLFSRKNHPPKKK